MSRTKTGRPPKLTPEVQARIEQALRGGNYREVAARFAGVSGGTLREWMKAGKRDSGKGRRSKHRDLYHAVRKAEADAEAMVVGRLMQAAAHDTKAMAFWLERKHPSRWGRTDRLKAELTGKDGGPVKVTKELTETEVMALWRAHQKSAPE